MPAAPVSTAFEEEDALRKFVTLVISIAASSLSEDLRGTFNCDASIMLAMPNALVNLERAGFSVADLAISSRAIIYHSLPLLAPSDLCVSAAALEGVGWQHDENSETDAFTFGHVPEPSSPLSASENEE